MIPLFITILKFYTTQRLFHFSTAITLQNLFCIRFDAFSQRLCKEREEKLKNIQSKITESQAKKDPARQAKLAYIAGPPKPSAQIRRKHIRHGTGEEVDRVVERQKQIKSQIENRHREQAAHTIPFNKIPKRERTAHETVQPRPRPRPDFIPKKAGQCFMYGY